MIRLHCGELPLYTVRENKKLFVKRCPQCGKRFYQGKRQPSNER